MSCYAPEVRDCSVKCTSATDCVAGQTCNADGYCVALADTRCVSSNPGTRADGGTHVNVHDAGGREDAPRDADAAIHGQIAIKIEGQGFVQLEGLGTCSTTCTYTVPLDVSVTSHAYADDDFYFDKWTTALCPDDNDATCTFVPAITTELGAKFRKDN